MPPILVEVLRLLVVLVLVTLFSAMFGIGKLAAVVCITLYVLYHFYQINRLHQWLNKRVTNVPEAGGIWGEILFRIHLIMLRNRKRKQRLVDYLTRFRKSTAAMPDATVILNAQFEIEWINKAAKDKLGLRSPSDLGQRITNLIRHPLFHRSFLENREKQAIEIPSPVNSAIVLSIIVIPYGKDQRLMIARDVTHIHKLEKIRKDFVANASHELRTPLTVLAGLAETMDESTMSAASMARSIKLMRQQTHRMAQIVTDLLLLTQLESDRPQNRHSVAVAALIRRLIEDATALSQNRHRFEQHLDEHLYLHCNEEEISSAFMNLLSNAVRYTPDGGKITIRWKPSSTGAKFEVADEGIGIADHHIKRLTERFYRVDVGRSRNTGGTGLGLAIVKHVMDRYQGKLSIKSTLGSGSIFCCHFPAEIVEEHPCEENAHQQTLDDNRDISKLLS